MTKTENLLQDALITYPRTRNAMVIHYNHKWIELPGLWSAYLGYPITSNQVAGCMALLKVSGLLKVQIIMDHYQDAIAYIAIYKTCSEYSAGQRL
jgi:hypothetical protein